MKKRLIAAALTMAMAAGMMTGCGGSGKPAESVAATAAADAGNTEAAKAEEAKTEASQDGRRRRRAHRRCNAYQGPSEMEPGRRQHEGRAGGSWIRGGFTVCEQ